MALKQTRGLVKLKGQITRLDDRSIKDDFQNDRCKKISFAVKTSETNEVPVQIFGYKNDKAYYLLKTAKGEKAKTEAVDWEDRYEAPKKDAQLMGVHIRPAGQKEVVIKTSYDAIDEIYEKFSNGDYVYVQCSTALNSYEGQDGQKKTQMNLEIDRIFEWDHDAEVKKNNGEEPEEMSVFQQIGIFMGAEKVKNEETKETEVHTDVRIITDNKGAFEDFTYVLPVKSDSSKKLANGLLKKVKPYDEIKIKGFVRNEVIVEEAQVDEEDDWGGDDVVGLTGTIKSYRKVYELANFDTAYWKENKGKYSESDFETDDFDSEDAIDFGDEDDDF